MPESQTAPTSQLDRADLVLRELEQKRYLTATQLIAATGIPRSSAHRLLTHMVKRRWLLRVGDCYEIGVRMFEVGTIGLRNHWFHRIALPHLWELQRRTRLTVHLAYLDGGDVVYWDKLTEQFGVNLPTRIGGHQPAHCTALGKALLATEPDRYLERPEFGALTRQTPQTITTREQLHDELTRVRDTGVALDRGEALRQVSCIAASVDAGHTSTSDGHATTAAVSVCGPTEHITYPLQARVRVTAIRISREAAIHPMVQSQ